MMISLPIPSQEYSKFFLYFIFHQHRKLPSKIYLNMPHNATRDEIMEKIAQLTKVEKNAIRLGLLKDHKLIEYVGPDASALYLKDHPAILFGYEAPELAQETPENKEMTAETTKALVRTLILSEPKAIYESEKLVSYTRLVYIESEDTLYDVFVKVYSKMRPHILNYYKKEDKKCSIDMADWSQNTLRAEYNEFFADDIEGKWFYKLFYKDEGSKSKAKNCTTLDEKQKVVDFLRVNKINLKDLVFEVKFSK